MSKYIASPLHSSRGYLITSASYPVYKFSNTIFFSFKTLKILEGIINFLLLTDLARLKLLIYLDYFIIISHVLKKKYFDHSENRTFKNF